MRDLRTLLGLFVLIVLLLGFWLLSTWKKGDEIIRATNSRGYLAFVSDRDGQAHIWLKTPDGKERRVESASTSEDLEPTWRGEEGGTLLFVSDRKDRVSQVFEISLLDAAHNQLTQSSARKTNLSSNPDGSLVLHLAGGLVSVFDFPHKHSEQLVPPPTQAGEKDEGARAMMESWKNLFGSSAFRAVAWGRQAGTIVGVIRGDTDDVLIVQRYDMDKRQQEQPKVVMLAKRIEIAYHPKEEKVLVAFTLRNPKGLTPDPQSWHAPVDRDGGAERDSGFVVFDLANPKNVPQLIASPSKDETFIDPSWSPEGDRAALVVGKISGEDVQPTGLFVVRFEDGKPAAADQMDEGRCGDPSWSADGGRLAYTKGASGKRAIWMLDMDTSEKKPLVDAKGDNYSPRWSPKR